MASVISFFDGIFWADFIFILVCNYVILNKSCIFANEFYLWKNQNFLTFS